MSTDAAPLRFEFAFTFADRLKANLAVLAACPRCLLAALYFPLMGVVLFALTPFALRLLDRAQLDRIAQFARAANVERVEV